MFGDLREQMTDHALGAYPEPACGGVFGDDSAYVYRSLDDTANAVRDDFRIETVGLRKAEAAFGALRAIVLTHPAVGGMDANPVLHTPSAAEMRVQEALAVPFGIAVFHPAGTFEPFWFGDQCPIPPLMGRPFRHGVTDCYSLARDWYRLELGIVIPNFVRDWNWWVDGLDLYEDGFRRAGFHKVAPSDLRLGDGVLFRIRSKVANHAAVILDDGWMIHHPGAFRPYDVHCASHQQRVERWARHATHWLRHKDMPALPST